MFQNTLTGTLSTSNIQNHMDDFVGRLIGGNPATYGIRPKESNMIKEWINMFGAAPTVHGCYGSDGNKDCIPTYGVPKSVVIPSVSK